MVGETGLTLDQRGLGHPAEEVWEEARGWEGRAATGQQSAGAERVGGETRRQRNRKRGE